MIRSGPVCVLGHALVDVTFHAGVDPKLRMGGIAHAARTLWAMDVPYSLAYFAPEYLDAAVADFAQGYGTVHAVKVGNVLRSPNVVIVQEPTEAGPQGYEFLLRDEQQCSLVEEALDTIADKMGAQDFLIFPGGFDLSMSLRKLQHVDAGVHIDANFDPEDPSVLGALGRPVDTIILSTSSRVFQDRYQGSPAALRGGLLGTYAESLLLKENRGGSRLFTTSGQCIATPAQVRTVEHSVGVGDCFDAAYVVLRRDHDASTALAYAASIAAEYASTTCPDDLKRSVQATLAIPGEEIVELSGVRLPWEDRPSIHIYIAAPDFDYVDCRPIDRVVECLRYHNFTPRRPVIEGGQMGVNASPERRQMLCDADLRLIDECRMMVAVLPFDDPGTLIEIGLAVNRGMPVIVYDPYRRAENLMLTQLPHVVSSSLERVITGVFVAAAELRSIA